VPTTEDLFRIPDGDTFERFCRDLLASLDGISVESAPAIGPDGGKDLVIRQTYATPLDSRTARVLVQCKRTRRAASESDLGRFDSHMRAHGCTEYLLISVAGVTVSGRQLLENVDAQTSLWDGETVLEKLQSSPAAGQLVDKYGLGTSGQVLYQRAQDLVESAHLPMMSIIQHDASDEWRWLVVEYPGADELGNVVPRRAALTHTDCPDDSEPPESLRRVLEDKSLERRWHIGRGGDREILDALAFFLTGYRDNWYQECLLGLRWIFANGVGGTTYSYWMARTIGALPFTPNEALLQIVQEALEQPVTTTEINLQHVAATGCVRRHKLQRFREPLFRSLYARATGIGAAHQHLRLSTVAGTLLTLHDAGLLTADETSDFKARWLHDDYLPLLIEAAPLAKAICDESEFSRRVTGVIQTFGPTTIPNAEHIVYHETGLGTWGPFIHSRYWTTVEKRLGAMLHSDEQ